ncbi:MAG: hypothetical protein ACKO4S_12090, partial [Snowella sp.]
MKKRFMFSLSILPLLMLVSCAGSPEEQSATPPSPPTGQASPPPVDPPPATPPAGSQAKTPPVVTDKILAQEGLTPPTNPQKRLKEIEQQRLKEIKQARNNPFFPIIPVVNSGEADVDSQTGESQAIPGTPKTPKGGSSPSSTTGSRPT